MYFVKKVFFKLEVKSLIDDKLQLSFDFIKFSKELSLFEEFSRKWKKRNKKNKGLQMMVFENLDQVDCIKDISVVSEFVGKQNNKKKKKIDLIYLIIGSEFL